jgi:hypothetical protein
MPATGHLFVFCDDADFAPTPNARRSFCSVCPAGFGCPDPTTKQACVDGFYAPEGQTACAACPVEVVAIVVILVVLVVVVIVVTISSIT